MDIKYEEYISEDNLNNSDLCKTLRTDFKKINIQMSDSYGDTWDGNVFEIQNKSNSDNKILLTGPPQDINSNEESYYLIPGDYVLRQTEKGPFPDDITIIIKQENGQEEVELLNITIPSSGFTQDVIVGEFKIE